MAWFSKKHEPRVEGSKRKSRMSGLWAKCEACSEILYREELDRNLSVCPLCGHHMAWPARARLAWTLDAGTFEEHDRQLVSDDPLEFVDSKKYRDRVRSARKVSGEGDAFIDGVGQLSGHPVSIGVFNFQFMGGSMGSVVGEKVTRVFERATERRCPALVFSSSGGARMQEGIFSLMQMGKTSAAINRFRDVRKPFFSIMLHPTTGGVAASFAWLGDVILAEPNALIGFAGPRVIESTIRQKLPEGFQRSEFLLDKGMIDDIVPRPEMKSRLSRLLDLLDT